MLITSVDNKKIKRYLLLKNAKGRREEGLFLVEGMHLCFEAFKNHLLVDLLVLEGNSISFNYGEEITYISSNVMKKLSSLTTPTNVLGVCKIENKQEIVGEHLLLLDDIADPGNIGTIIRSTQGMLFSMNILYADLEQIIPLLKEEGYLVLGTDVNSGVDVRSVKVSKYALIMGNEGRGVKESIKTLCDKNLYIRMNDTCESLNVAVATSILLYELNRGSYE